MHARTLRPGTSLWLGFKPPSTFCKPWCCRGPVGGPVWSPSSPIEPVLVQHSQPDAALLAAASHCSRRMVQRASPEQRATTLSPIKPRGLLLIVKSHKLLLFCLSRTACALHEQTMEAGCWNLGQTAWHHGCWPIRYGQRQGLRRTGDVSQCAELHCAYAMLHKGTNRRC